MQTSEVTWWEKQWPWRAIGIALVVGLAYPALDVARGAHAAHPAVAAWWAPAVGFGIALWLFFIAFTWRRLSRLRTDDAGREIYRLGVIGWGVPWTIAMAIISAVRQAGGLSLDRLASTAFLAQLVVQLFVSLPLGLWAGYCFGRIYLGMLKTPRR